MRFPAVLAFAVFCVATVSAQAPGVYTNSAPPDRASLERLNLKTDWTTYLPLTGRADGVALVQTVDATQIIVQTKGGQVIAIDALTGAKQWSYRLPSQYVNVYPVCITEQFVFVVNIAKLICFHRYSGLVEFEFGLPGSATAGPVADKELVYVLLNGSKMNAYRYPAAIKVADKAKDRNQEVVNAADTVAKRYGTAANFVGLRDEAFTGRSISNEQKAVSGLGPNQQAPSISALPSVTPPYTLDNRGLYVTPSIQTLSSLRQPYQFKPDYMQYNQRTPSILVLPPAVAAAAELANFRPRGVEPVLVWTYTGTARFRSEPLLTDFDPISINKGLGVVSRIWAATDGPIFEAIDKRSGKSQIVARMQDSISSPLSGPFPLGDKQLGIVGLTDGTIVAVDLVKGGYNGPRIEWRASAGGFMNHKPIVAKDAVFASGDQSGIARVELESGELTWKTESGADRVLAINDEFVYAYDHRGRLAVYDRKKPTDPETKRAYPLTTMDIGGFAVAPSNDVSDRILLAGDSGVLICLRDAAAKYLVPVPLIPPAPKADRKVEPKDAAAPADPAAPKPADTAAPKPAEAKPIDPKPAPPAEPKKKDGM